MATQGHEVVRVSQLKLITDEVQEELDNKSNIDHTHVMDNITDLPEWTKESTKPTYTAEEVGAAPANHTHSNATTSTPGFMSAEDKQKLDDLSESGGSSITVDSALSTTSTNPVENRVITNSLNGKSNIGHTHLVSDITNFPTSMPASDVYAWAKQPNKPTYSYSEVGAAATSHTHGNATQYSAGFMSASDKIKLDNLDTSGGGSIGAGDVGTTELANYSVTNIKLASNAVTADKIASGAVDTSELASGAVTSAKLDTSVSNDIAQGVQAYEMIQDGFPRYYYDFTQRKIGSGRMYGGYTVVPSMKLVLVQCYCENASFSGTTRYSFSTSISSTYRPNTTKVAFVTRAGDQNVLFDVSTAGRVSFYATGTCTGTGGATVIYFYGAEAN